MSDREPINYQHVSHNTVYDKKTKYNTHKYLLGKSHNTHKTTQALCTQTLAHYQDQENTTTGVHATRLTLI